MKLLRVGPKGAEKPAVLHTDGTYRDLSMIVPDLKGEALTPTGMQKIRAADASKLPVLDKSLRIGPCVGFTGKFICVGLNYADHAAETGAQIPKEPILFMKATSSLNGPHDDVMLPKGSQKSDWEVELGIVIGSVARYVSVHDSLKHVAGYCIVNDVSEREFQIERGGQWTKGKSADTFCPMGPWLVTADEVKDPGKLDLFCEVNGKKMQDGTTANFIFRIPFLISYVSQFMTLLPGDVISTGTPAGVAMGMNPQVYLKPGDVVELGIDGLGTSRQNLKAYGNG